MNKKRERATIMALETNVGFLNKLNDNAKTSQHFREMLMAPIQECDVVQNNIPWRHERIDIPSDFIYQDGQYFEFCLPRQGLIDPRSIRLSFNLRAYLKDITSATFTQNEVNVAKSRPFTFTYDINSIFRTVQMKNGAHQMISDQVEYGLLSKTVSKYATEPQLQTTLRSLYSGHTPCNRTLFQPNGVNMILSRAGYHNANNHTTENKMLQPMSMTRRYLVQVQTGLTLQEKPIVLDAFHEDLRLQFYLHNASEVLYYTTASVSSPRPTWLPVDGRFVLQLGRPSLHFTIYTPSPQLRAEIDLMLDQHKIRYQFVAYDYFRIPLQARTPFQSLQIPIGRKKWLKYGLAQIRCDQDTDLIFSTHRTYSALDPVSYTAPGNQSINNVNSSGASVRSWIWPDREFIQSSHLKEYQWKYLDNYIPEKPVRVFDTQIWNFPTAQNAAAPADPSSKVVSGTVNGFTNTLTEEPASITHPSADASAGGFSNSSLVEATAPVNQRVFSPSVENWYMIEQLFLRQKELQLGFALPITDGMPSLLDTDPRYTMHTASEDTIGANAVGAVRMYGARSAAGVVNDRGRLPTELLMVGMFSSPHYDGNMYALGGGSNNETLSLNLNFNGISPQPYLSDIPRMFVDVFVAYDNILDVSRDGITLLN